MAGLEIPIGPLKSFKYGGLTLHPKEDSNVNINFGDIDYEVKLTADGEPYSTAAAVPATLQQDIILTVEEFKRLNDLKGKVLAGTATTSNGNVLTLNMAIDGALEFSDGVSLTLKGTMRIQ